MGVASRSQPFFSNYWQRERERESGRRYCWFNVAEFLRFFCRDGWHSRVSFDIWHASWNNTVMHWTSFRSSFTRVRHFATEWKLLVSRVNYPTVCGLRVIDASLNNSPRVSKSGLMRTYVEYVTLLRMIERCFFPDKKDIIAEIYWSSEETRT